MKESIATIIPVYNVEKYLDRCAQSLIRQTLKHCMMLFADDGSTDSSSEKCDEYAQVDERVIVIHTKNGGVSRARNFALKVCDSDYVTFCDSDDYCESNWLENLFDAMVLGKADLVSGCMVSVDEAGNALKDRPNPNRCGYILTDDEARTEFIIKKILLNHFEWSACTKLFDNRIIQNKKLLFCETCDNFAEDMGFVLEYVLYCSKIVSCGISGYYYVQHSQSMMAGSKNIIKLNAVNEVSKHFGQRYLSDNHSNYSEKTFPVIHYLILFDQYSKIVSTQRFDLIEKETAKIKDYTWFRKYVVRTLISYPILKAYLGKISAKEAILYSGFLISKTWKLYKLLQRLKNSFSGGAHG